MGYQFQRRKARIEFEDGTSYPGVEVTVLLDLPFGETMRVSSRDDICRFFGGCPDNCAAEHNHFERVIQEWNLEAAGQPIAICYEGMQRTPARFLDELWMQYLRAQREPSAPLGEGSNSGVPASPPIPMESL